MVSRVLLKKNNNERSIQIMGCNLKALKKRFFNIFFFILFVFCLKKNKKAHVQVVTIMDPNPSKSVTKIRNDGESWVDAFDTFAKGGEQFVKVDEETIDDSKTWEIVSWDTVREDMAKTMLERENLVIQQEQIGNFSHQMKCHFSHFFQVGFEQEASAKWDTFYMSNKSNFFKNRNYLRSERKTGHFKSFLKNFSAKNFHSSVALDLVQQVELNQ